MQLDYAHCLRRPFDQYSKSYVNMCSSLISGAATAGWSGEVIVEADSWRGPYRLISSKDVTRCTYCEEDPFMWQVGEQGYYTNTG